MTSVLTHIFLLASVQGFLLAILLFTRRQNHAANTVLGLLVGALSLDLLQAAYTFNHLYEVYPHLMGITYVFPFLYGPLFYLYARLLTSEKRKLEWKHLLHFLPAFVILVYASPVYFLTGPEKIDFIYLMNTDRPLGFSIIDNLKPIHGLIYTILVIRVITRHDRRIRDAYSNIDRINLLWLRSLTVGVGIIWSIVVGSVMGANLFNLHFSGFDYAIYFCISLLVYTIGYMGLKQAEVFQQANDDRERRSDRGVAEGQPSRYVKSGLSDSTADEILGKLRELMELKKPYLDGNLTLGKLAEILSVSPHNLSEAMNTRMNQSFYDYVNSYRVAEVKRRLQGGDAEQYSFLSIAYESGFTSKTSFNTIFKKQTGMTPTEFIELQTPRSLNPVAGTARPEETG